MGDVENGTFPEREKKDFYFKQLKNLQVYDAPADLPTRRSYLVAVCNKYGLCFVGCPQGFKIIKTATIGQIDKENEDKSPNAIVTQYPSVYVNVGHPVHHIGLSCDDGTLSVCCERGGGVAVRVYDIPTIATQGGSQDALGEVTLASNPGISLVNLLWNPTIPGQFATCFSNGVVSLWEMTQSQINQVSSLPAATNATAICWSPKGKQIVIGHKDGHLTQYTPNLQEVKKETPSPDIFKDSPHQVTSICWVSGLVFVNVYTSHEEGEPPKCIVICNQSKTSQRKMINFEDVYFGLNDEREVGFYITHLPDWNVTLTVSCNAFEVAALGNEDEWEKWTFSDESRAEMPLTSDKEETYPMGMAIDLTSTVPIQENEHTLPPAPILLLLSTKGVLCPFYLVNKSPKAKHDIIKPPQPLPPPGNRPKLSGGGTAPVKPQESAAQPTLSTSKQEPKLGLFKFPDSSATNQPTTRQTSASPGLFPTGTSTPSGGTKPSIMGNLFKLPAATSPLTVPSQGTSPFSTARTLFPGMGASASPLTQTPSVHKPASQVLFKPTPTTQPASQSLPVPQQPRQSQTEESEKQQQQQLQLAQQRQQQQLAQQQQIKDQQLALERQQQQQLAQQQQQQLAQQQKIKDQQLAQERQQQQQLAQQQQQQLAQQRQQQIREQQQQQQKLLEEQELTKKQHAQQQQKIELQRQQQFRSAQQQLSPTSQENLELSVSNCIQEEIIHFNKELARHAEAVQQLKGFCSTAMPSRSLENLRKQTHEAERMCNGLKQVTKEHDKDIEEIKGKLLNSFEILEDARVQSDRAKDPRYHHLLKSRSLDPGNSEKMRNIRNLYMNLDKTLREVNLYLDEEWNKENEARSKIQRPSMDVIYRTLKTHHAISHEQGVMIEKLIERMKQKRILPPHWSKPTATYKTPGEGDLSSLEESMGNVNLSNTTRSPVKVQDPVPANKVTQLANMLRKRQTTPIRKSRIVVPASSPPKQLLKRLEQAKNQVSPPLPVKSMGQYTETPFSSKPSKPLFSSTPGIPGNNNQQFKFEQVQSKPPVSSREGKPPLTRQPSGGFLSKAGTAPNVNLFGSKPFQVDATTAPVSSGFKQQPPMPVVKEKQSLFSYPKPPSAALQEATPVQAAAQAAMQRAEKPPTNPNLDPAASIEPSSMVRHGQARIDKQRDIETETTAAKEIADAALKASQIEAQKSGSKPNSCVEFSFKSPEAAKPGLASTGQGVSIDRVPAPNVTVKPLPVSGSPLNRGSFSNSASSQFPPPIGHGASMNNYSFNSLHSSRPTLSVPAQRISDSNVATSKISSPLAKAGDQLQQKATTPVLKPVDKSDFAPSPEVSRRLFGDAAASQQGSKESKEFLFTASEESSKHPDTKSTLTGSTVQTLGTNLFTSQPASSASSEAVKGKENATNSSGSQFAFSFGSKEPSSATSTLGTPKKEPPTSSVPFAGRPFTSQAYGFSTSASSATTTTNSSLPAKPFSSPFQLTSQASTAATDSVTATTSTPTEAMTIPVKTSMAASTPFFSFGGTTSMFAAKASSASQPSASKTGGLFTNAVSSTTTPTSANKGLFAQSSAQVTSTQSSPFSTLSSTRAPTQTIASKGGVFSIPASIQSQPSQATTSQDGAIVTQPATTSTQVTTSKQGVFATSNASQSSPSQATTMQASLFSTSTTTQPSSQPTQGVLFGSPATTQVSLPASTTQESSFGTLSKPQTQGGLFATTPSSLFGASTTTSTTNQGGLFGAATMTSSTNQGGLFGAATRTSSTNKGGLFGATTTTSSTNQGGLFGAATTTSSTNQGGLFGAATTTSSTNQGGLFGAATTTSSTTKGGLFGAATMTSSTNQGGLFGAATTTSSTNQGGLFGAATTTSSTNQGGLLGASTTTTNVFGSTASTTSQANRPFSSASTTQVGLFGSPATTSTQGGLFGSTTSTSSQGGVLGSTTTATTQGLFGSTTPKTTQVGLFGSTTSTANEGGLFGSTSATTSQGSPFGSGTSTTSQGGLFGSTGSQGGLFGKATTTQGSLFGTSTSTTSQPGFFGSTSSTSTGGLFGSTTTTTSQGLFGSQPTSSSSAFGQPAFGQPAFGQTSTAAAAPAFGQSAFSKPQVSQSSGGTGLGFGGFGLGGPPTQADRNPFSTPTAGQTSSSDTSLFGSSTGNAFKPAFGSGSPSGFSSQPSGFGGGTFSKGAGNVASSGFAVSSIGSSGSPGFGGAPSFGSAPAFGSSSAFGASPAFGGTPSFGGSPPMAPAGSVFGSGTSGFGSSTGNPSFGALAQQKGSPTFGSVAQQSGGFGGFGQQRQQQQSEFGGFGGGSSPFGGGGANSGSSFNSWR